MKFFEMQILLQKRTTHTGLGSLVNRDAGAGALSPTTGGLGAPAVQLEDTEARGVNLDEVVPLFRIRPGRSTSSFGISCGYHAGLSTTVLTRAMEVRLQCVSNVCFFLYDRWCLVQCVCEGGCGLQGGISAADRRCPS